MFLRKFLALRAAPLVVSLVVTCAAVAPQVAFAQASAPAATEPAPAAAPAPVTAAPVANTGITSKEIVDNPYGLGALWAQGDFVSRGTLIILVIMSMGSWYILITKLYESFKIASEAKVARKSFFKAASLA